jgi:N-acetylglucosamine-6-phosphate deacetylase
MTLGITGGSLVLPDRVRTGALLLHEGRIAVVGDGPLFAPRGADVLLDIQDGYVVPGFVDVHVHGVEGHDTLDGEDAIAAIAARLPRYGVTAFCPTTVACDPAALRGVLHQVGRARTSRVANAARVLPAHLESNFINPEYNGAQPLGCLRVPARLTPGTPEVRLKADTTSDFSAADILEVIAAFRADVGIVTLAPELPGGIDFVRELVDAGHRVSLGHSGADYATAMAAIEAGARHATHLFNRMTPMTHRAPGLAGAILSRGEVVAELICDGYHVHPVVAAVAFAAKSAAGIMAITDGTAGSGLPAGATARLGGRTIHVREHAAELDDGTLAGSTLTMDGAFRNVVEKFGRSIVDAAAVCSTTPARQLGLAGMGAIAEGAVADLVVLDRDLRVTHTIIAGEIVYQRR